MKTDTSTFLAQQIVRLRRRDQIRRLMQRDKTPLAILFMAAVVGTLTGLVGVAFEKTVSWVQNMRIGALVQVADHAFLLWPLAFILSALLAMVGYFLVRKFAPEAGGSGIPEIEGALEELRPVRWWRVLPVKFIGGMGTLGAGMVLGREGPTVQIGGNLGRMVLDVFRMRSAEARHTLLATGAAAGLSAAFNAPLAGILFIIEEMRPQFRYNLISIKAVFTGVIMSALCSAYLTAKRRLLKSANCLMRRLTRCGYTLSSVLFLAASGRYLIRWCCVPRICFSAFMAAKLKNGCLWAARSAACAVFWG